MLGIWVIEILAMTLGQDGRARRRSRGHWGVRNVARWCSRRACWWCGPVC